MAGGIPRARVDNRDLTAKGWQLSRGAGQRTLLRWTLLACSIAALLLVGWRVGLAAHVSKYLDFAESPLVAENARLHTELENTRRALEVERATRSSLEGQLNALNERNGRLTDEINFIRNARSGR